MPANSCTPTLTWEKIQKRRKNNASAVLNLISSRLHNTGGTGNISATGAYARFDRDDNHQ